MRARPRIWTLIGGLIVTAAGLGCEGDPGTANLNDGGFRPGQSDGGAGSGGGFNNTDARGGGSFDAAPRPDRAPVEPNAMAKQILPARAELLGGHRVGCSYQEPASTPDGSRWCAFSLPGDRLGQLQLWVINTTKATAAGAAVKCDGTSPDCVKLSDNLFSGSPEAGPAYPSAHRFFGDTLIYHADAQSRPTDLYQGPVYAWRPGWAMSKKLTSNAGILCNGHASAEVAMCLENITPEDVDPPQFDLHAGRLSDGPFKKVATITPLRGGEATQWRWGFTGDGEYFAWSTGGKTLSARETLYVAKTAELADPTKHIPVGGMDNAAGISRWGITADKTKWVYFRNYNYNVMGDPRGTLTMADFPSGANETTLVGGVGVFQLLVDADDKTRGIAYLDRVTEGVGTFKILKDLTKGDDPTNIVEAARNIGSVPIFSPDLRFAAYAKNFDEDVGTSDFHLVKADGTGACALTTSTKASIFGFPFTRNGNLAMWVDDYRPETDSADMFVAASEGCAGKRKVSTDTDFWFVNGNQGVVYSDESDGDVVTLRFVQFPDGSTWPAASSVIQKQTERLFAVLPNYTGVLFKVTTGMTATSGIYHYALPFGSAPAPTDAGAPPTPVDAAVADAATPDAGATD